MISEVEQIKAHISPAKYSESLLEYLENIDDVKDVLFNFLSSTLYSETIPEQFSHMIYLSKYVSKP